MPAWVSAHRGQLPFHPGTSFIRMALLLATLAAFAVKGRESIWTHLYFGGAATMLINVFVPHLPATLLFRHYTPGVVTAVLINLPLNTLLLYKAVRERRVTGVRAVRYALLVPLVVAGFILALFDLAWGHIPSY